MGVALLGCNHYKEMKAGHGYGYVSGRAWVRVCERQGMGTGM